MGADPLPFSTLSIKLETSEKKGSSELYPDRENKLEG